MDSIALIRQELKDTKDDFRVHAEDDREFQKDTVADIKDIKDSITKIKDNHLAHIQVAMEKTSTNVDWLMRYHWIIAGASIGGLVTGILNIIR